MADHDPHNHALVRSDRRDPDTPAIDEDLPDPIAPFDAATFDPAEFEWRPVPRRPRADGWTPEVQRGFIQALADTGMVESAARAVDMSVQSAYRLRNAPGGEGFAGAWHAALGGAARRLLDLAFQRAIQGEDIPVFDRDGCRIGAKWKANDRLTMFLLRAYMPERFRHAHESVRRRSEAPAPPLIPVAEAVAALEPARPAEPHKLLSEERLEDLVDGARAMAHFHDLYPADDRERYVQPRIEGNAPAARARAEERRQREWARKPLDEACDDPDDFE